MGQSSSRQFPLLEAAFVGDVQKIKQLLCVGCSPIETVNLKRYGEVTPVLAAIHNNHLHALRLLLVNMTVEEINLAVGNRKLSALHVAASKGGDEITEALLTRGADIYLRDIDGNTALLRATIYKRLSTVWVLCERVRSSAKAEYIDLANNRGQTALHIACEIGNLALVSCLLKQGANPNLPIKTRGHKGSTPIVAAVVSGNHEIVLALLTAGSRVDVDIENRRGLTLLHLAVLFNYPKIVKLLMEHGISIETGHTKGTPYHRSNTPTDMPSPLLIAAAYGRSECFKELFDSSPTEEIARCIEKGGRLDLVAFVVEKIVGRVPETPEPPMAWAVQYPCRFVTRSMTVLGFRGNMQFTSGVEHMTKGHFLCAELLLKAGAGITSDQLLKVQQNLMHARITGSFDEDLRRLNTLINDEIWQCSKCGIFGLWPNTTDLKWYCSSICEESATS